MLLAAVSLLAFTGTWAGARQNGFPCEAGLVAGLRGRRRRCSSPLSHVARLRHKGLTIDTTPNAFTRTIRAQLFWGIYESAETNFIERYSSTSGSLSSWEQAWVYGRAHRRQHAKGGSWSVLNPIEAFIRPSSTRSELPPMRSKSNSGRCLLPSAQKPGEGASTEGTALSRHTCVGLGAGERSFQKSNRRDRQRQRTHRRPRWDRAVCPYIGHRGSGNQLSHRTRTCSRSMHPLDRRAARVASRWSAGRSRCPV